MDEDGGRLRSARVAAGWSQRAVAEASGLSSQYYNDLEHGRRVAPDETYARVCAALGLASDRPAARVRALEAENARLRVALERLERVGGEFSLNMAGPWWDELCGALSEAKAALR